MRQLLASVAALAMLTAQIASASEPIHWVDDFSQACERAAEQRRLVLLHFYSDNCPPCRHVEKYVFTDPQVALAINRSYIPMKVHVEQLPQLAQKYNIQRWPTDVVVTPNGLEVHRTVSPRTSEAYATLVEQVAMQAGIFNTQPALGSNAAPPLTSTVQKGPYSAAPQPEAQQAPPGNVYAQSPSPYLPAGQTAYQPNTSPYAAQPPAAAQPPYSPPPAQEPVVNRYTQSPTPQIATNPWVTSAQHGQNAVAPQAPATPPAAPAVPPLAPSHGYANQSLATTGATPSPPAATGVQYVPSSKAPPVALDGCCAVTLLESNQWKKGDAQFGAVHRGRTYLFTTVAEQQKFLTDPDRYCAVLSGYDAVRFTTSGQLIEGHRQFGVRYRGQIFLFADENSLKQFSASPHIYATGAYQAMMQSETGGTVLR